VQRFSAHSAVEDYQVTNFGGETSGQSVEVFLALSQHNRRAAVLNCLDDLLADQPVSPLIRDQVVVEVMKLKPDIRIGRPEGLKVSWTDKDTVLKGALSPRELGDFWRRRADSNR